jgi:hypothetical protein
MTTDSDERPEWVSWPGFSLYEASHRGHVRSVDGRVVNGRRLRGVVLKPGPDDEGYLWVNVTGDDGKRHRIPVHRAVLLAHAGAPEPGQETLHKFGPADNRFPEAIGWGTHKENHDDQVAAGTAVVPESFECVTAGCDGRTRNPGRRCLGCVTRVGQLAAQLLNAGMPSQEVAERFGYTGDRWVYDLAVAHGGFAGDRAAARTQRPSLVQRVQILGILRLARRSGQLRDDAA